MQQDGCFGNLILKNKKNRMIKRKRKGKKKEKEVVGCLPEGRAGGRGLSISIHFHW